MKKAAPVKIISGGQTGVDTAALDFALEAGIEHGGWVPKGRTNEAGTIPSRYGILAETPTADVRDRTQRNIDASDATLVFVDGRDSPGTQYTVDRAKAVGKPVLVVDVSGGEAAARRRISDWLGSVEVQTLNIAGPRASEAPDLARKVIAILRLSLGQT
ncbi:MAG: putative molybdenum carrier protein [Pseudomonadota bacterium]